MTLGRSRSRGHGGDVNVTQEEGRTEQEAMLTSAFLKGKWVDL